MDYWCFYMSMSSWSQYVCVNGPPILPFLLVILKENLKESVVYVHVFKIMVIRYLWSCRIWYSYGGKRRYLLAVLSPGQIARPVLWFNEPYAHVVSSGVNFEFRITSFISSFICLFGISLNSWNANILETAGFLSINDIEIFSIDIAHITVLFRNY